jgi:DMSO/TMAO reductase YedYZ molybdopterin-dependent catalytic subunit
MENTSIHRRTVLKAGISTLAGLTAQHIAGPSQAFGQVGDEVIPWLDHPPPDPFPTEGNLLKWEALESWIIPAHEFFFVSHYGIPEKLDEASWRVDISGY